MLDEHFDVFENTITLKVVSEPEIQERRTKIENEIERNGTRHEAIVPLSKEYVDLPEKFSDFKAKNFNFVLDDFQKMSICSLERDESVIVSAHTSSGKTAVAEYAVSMSINNKQRVVYTSPIKALSNQKFRELQAEFQDVGLMTGDVTLNPTATCLVMTTEILRNMLYRGSEVIREVHWIIFDEIHYMRDKERGVVWEETIILLPEHVRMVFLSATIPNAREFAEWIAYIQNQIVHVVYTEKRVTPLVHYFRTDKRYLIKDDRFYPKNFQASIKNIRKGKLDIVPIVEESSLPVIVFSFRRKECESLALTINHDYNTEQDKEIVGTIFSNAVSTLRKEDSEIPIIQNILPMLLRGIGIHHSGLLPIIKEVVEILFQEGLIKVLFATETFSIGLNMPAKSVIFTSLKKFDGTEKRLVSSGEYIQMSGRAGRRGIDDHGVVVSVITEHLNLKEITALFSTCSDKLNSAFRLTYNMILNLMRVEGLNPVYLMSRSFHHFQTYKLSLDEENELVEVYKRYRNVPETQLASLYIERENLMIERCDMLYKGFLEYLKKGRVVDLCIPKGGNALIIRNAIVDKVGDFGVECHVLTNDGVKKMIYKHVSDVYNIRVKPELRVFNKKFERLNFECVLDDRIKQVEDKIRSYSSHSNEKSNARANDVVENADNSMRDVEDTYFIPFDVCLICGNIPRACISKCEVKYNANGEPLFDSVNRKLAEKLLNNEASAFFRDQKIREEYLKKSESLSKIREVYHMEESKKMIQVLRKLEYCDEAAVLIKGRMACEISTGDELVLTEMMFNGDFTKMAVDEYVPLLSCLIFTEWDMDNFILSERNEACYKLLRNAVERVCKVMNDCGIQIDLDVYLKNFSYELMDVVKMWVCGYTFVEICNKTSVFEGSIIRTLKRLEELLRQLGNAARVIGNSDLENMFAIGITKIKRDIVFANSLYL